MLGAYQHFLTKLSVRAQMHTVSHILTHAQDDVHMHFNHVASSEEQQAVTV